MQGTLASSPVLALRLRSAQLGDLLQKFETCMALTNIAGTGASARHLIVERGGIAILDDAMLSSHDMVRRSGTEALNNMITEPKVVRTEDRLRLHKLL